ncbi:hypothetical protein ACOSQ3_008093 [Xanthoceras sorbifolium]
MTGVFNFSAQLEEMERDEDVVKDIRTAVRTKRARASEDFLEVKKSTNDSFKAKLMGLDNQSSWTGFEGQR